ncbi:MAG TPA: hypothetical protein PLV68_06070, partial [Ilumatobacteraceae bacterium]|nr:hypothetical protein [Ilumatobacteraceae bacterium]
AEWEDRYGPLPEAAEALLVVGQLRAECNRLGITEITITSNQARMAPLTLRTSEELRLRRLARDAIMKDDVKQLVVPIRRGVEPATFLVNFLRELIPAPVPAPA